MHWRKLKIHLKNWANELEEGYHADAKYVRDELLPKLDTDLPIYNARGKNPLVHQKDKRVTQCKVQLLLGDRNDNGQTIGFAPPV